MVTPVPVPAPPRRCPPAVAPAEPPILPGEEPPRAPEPCPGHCSGAGVVPCPQTRWCRCWHMAAVPEDGRVRREPGAPSTGRVRWWGRTRHHSLGPGQVVPSWIWVVLEHLLQQSHPRLTEGKKRLPPSAVAPGVGAWCWCGMLDAPHRCMLLPSLSPSARGMLCAALPRSGQRDGLHSERCRPLRPPGHRDREALPDRYCRG